MAHNTHRRGTGLIYTTLALMVLLGCVTLMVDYGQMMSVRAELQSAVDAATLAGAGGLSVSPAEARARAKQTALQNIVDGRPLVLLDSDIQIGNWSPDGRLFVISDANAESVGTAIRVTGHLSHARGTAVKLPFVSSIGGGGLLDQRWTSVGRSAGETGYDLVLVQDVTNSFAQEIDDAKLGNHAILDHINANGGEPYVGLVAFTGWGKTISEMKQVSASYNALKSAVNSLDLGGRPGMPPASGTDISTGIAQAVTVFANRAASSTRPKAMIIISDGEPSQNSKGQNPKRNASELLTLAQQKADAAWAEEIHIFVVFYDKSNSATSAAKLRSLVRGSGTFVHVTDPDALPAAILSAAKAASVQLVQ